MLDASCNLPQATDSVSDPGQLYAHDPAMLVSCSSICTLRMRERVVTRFDRYRLSVLRVMYSPAESLAIALA